MKTIFDPITIGELIQQYRKRHHISRQTLAQNIGVSTKTLQRWENGMGSPAIKSLIRLSDEMKIPLKELFVISKNSQ